MRNSTRIKHVAHLVWLCKKVSFDINKCALSHPPLTPRRPPTWMLRALQRLDATDTPASARDKRGRSADALRASPHSATRPLARRQPLRQGSTQFRGHASPSVCAAPRRHASPPPTPTRWCAGLVLSATFQRSGTPALPPMTSRLTAPPASCHPPPRTGTRSGTSPVCLTQ
jgi:hypothetical protein